MFKKKIAFILSAAIIAASPLTCMAERITYNITVNSTATNQDNLSKKAVKKNDGDKYFYVRPTYYDSNNAAFFAESKQKNGNAHSYQIYVENGLDETRRGRYKTSAPGGVYYYMQTSYGYSRSGSVHSKGYYTP